MTDLCNPSFDNQTPEFLILCQSLKPQPQESEMLPLCPDYVFRNLLLEDVDQINRLYQEEYGPNYPYLLRADRAAMSTLSTVALHEGKVVGFARATPYAGNSRVFEFGGLIVDVAHRHLKVARVLTLRRMEAVMATDPLGIFSEPVCYRQDCASQYNLDELHFRHWGICAFKYPEIHVDLLGEQPESVAMAFMSVGLKPVRRPLYLPEAYWPMVLALWPEATQSEISCPPDGHMPDVILHKNLTTRHQRGSCFVDIPANWPESRACIETYRAQGYLLAGLLPGFGTLPMGLSFDYVTLYKPGRERGYDFSLVHVLPSLEPFKALMADEYARHGRSVVHPSHTDLCAVEAP